MKVTLITARLRFDTPGGVTGTEVRAGENGYLLPIRKDPSGKISLPGTTIAGNLRAHCATVDTALAELFGDTPEQLEEKHTKAKQEGTDPPRAVPSSIHVLGTVLRTGGKVFSHTRNSTDRKRGAARNHHFHRVEMVEKGTEFDVMLRWNDADPSVLRHRFLPALQQWHPMLGRGVTRGAGWCSLVGWGTRDYDLDQADDLLAWLQDTGLESYPLPSKAPMKPPQPQYVLDADVSIVNALHCGTKEQEPFEEKKNRLKAFRHNDDFVVPGSTLKGILRSRAEYICRVLRLSACEDQQCGNCRPCLLFGFTREDAAHRARIAVEDATIQNPQWEFRPHVSIDRFTGGARSEALYEHEVVTEGSFPVRARWLGPAPQDPESNGSSNTVPEAEQNARLLHAVLQDLNDGYLGIGARTTAGYGSVRVDTCRSAVFELTDLAGVLRDPVTASAAKGDA